MSFQDFGSVLDDVTQSDEAALCDACELWREALLHMVPDSLKVKVRCLSHQAANSWLHSMKGICHLTSR